MTCQRSGFCCIQYDVLIVDQHQWCMRYKPNKLRCPHLVGGISKPAECAVHDEWWFEATPCARHNEGYGNDPCRIGVAFRDNVLSQDFQEWVDNMPQATLEELEVRNSLKHTPEQFQASLRESIRIRNLPEQV